MTDDMGASAPKGKPSLRFRKEPAFLLKLRGAVDTFLELENLDEWAVFWRLIFLSYYHAGPLADNDTIVAKHLGISARRWRPIKAKLIASRHLQVVDGMLIPKNVIERLAERAQVRETAAADGRAGGHSSGQNRGQNPGGSDEELGPFARDSAANQPRTSREPTEYDDPKQPNSRGYPVKNRSLVESGKVESEDNYLDSDSTSARDETPDTEADTEPDDEGAEGVDASAFPVTLPSRAQEDPLANVVFPLDQITDRNPKALHGILCAVAGPRLQIDDALRNSASALATALLHGCDPNDMAAVVVDRTNGKGGPIETWRYFLTAWYDARDRKAGRVAA